MYIVQFTAANVPMGELVHQMEREPHEVLHDFFVIFCFLHEVLDIYIFSFIFKTSNFNVQVHVHCVCRFPIHMIGNGLRPY